MYVIRNKTTKEILHINPAPLQQNLAGKDVYFKFDAGLMEIGKTDGYRLPQNFKINSNGIIESLSLEEEISNGTHVLQPDEKLVNGQVVKKSLRELIEQGIIVLLPSEKLVENETGAQIVQKSLQEQVNEGLIILINTQKIKDNRIVTKTLQEQVDDGLIDINEPFEFVTENRIDSRTPEEALHQGFLITKAHFAKALELVDQEIEETIRMEYSIGEELKITKLYIDWLNEEKPEDDSRETTYNNMQESISTIKASFAALKNTLKERLNELNS